MWNMYKRFAPNDKTWLTIIRLEYQEYLKNALDDTSQQFKLPFPKTIEEIEDRIWNFIFIVQALGYALSSLEEARALLRNPKVFGKDG